MGQSVPTAQARYDHQNFLRFTRKYITCRMSFFTWLALFLIVRVIKSVAVKRIELAPKRVGDATWNKSQKKVKKRRKKKSNRQW